MKKALIIGSVALLVFLISQKVRASVLPAVRLIDENYHDAIAHYAVPQGIPVKRIAAMIYVESLGDPHAAGKLDEVGLMQIRPVALSDVNRIFRTGYSFVEMYDPVKNIHAGTLYLKWLMTKLGSLDKATQAYNAGIGTVSTNPAAGLVYLTKVKAAELFFT